jgi:dCTP deaminase
MILSDITISKLIKDKQLATNVSDVNIQPASLDITIGNSFSFPDPETSNGIIKIGEKIKYKEIIRDTYILLPNQFVLATTEQYFKLPNNLTAFVEGRSSIGRLGLFIQNAGWVDPGFEGQITLELYNASQLAIELKYGIRVGQLVFSPTDVPVKRPYIGKYQGQTGATGSMIYLD